MIAAIFNFNFCNNGLGVFLWEGGAYGRDILFKHFQQRPQQGCVSEGHLCTLICSNVYIIQILLWALFVWFSFGGKKEPMGGV